MHHSRYGNNEADEYANPGVESSQGVEAFVSVPNMLLGSLLQGGAEELRPVIQA